jgi:folate-dependent phosphoribosylglycinamide formyltransferase PurN
MSTLSVMVFTRDGPRHAYFAHALSSRSRVVAVVQESGMHWTWRNVVDTFRPDRLHRRTWRWLRENDRRAASEEARFFFGETEPVRSGAARVLRATSINDARVVRLAVDLAPDLIGVFGTTLIRGELLSRGRLGIVNLHGGIAPRYRGSDSIFWALYNDEPDQVGCTLHFLDRGIDTGPLIAHVRPEVRDGDDERTLCRRAYRDAIAAFQELLDRMERGERFGQPQGEKGRLYSLRDRGWRHDRNLAERLRRGLLRGVQLPPRVTWYPA